MNFFFHSHPILFRRPPHSLTKNKRIELQVTENELAAFFLHLTLLLLLYLEAKWYLLIANSFLVVIIIIGNGPIIFSPQAINIKQRKSSNVPRSS